ncbi:MAG: CHAT domain-containing protein [Pleurocapsa sp.]
MGRRILALILSALLGLMFALNFPVRSQEVQPLQLAIKAQEFYDARRLQKAAELWQQAAAAFESQGDRTGVTKSLINQSQVLQDLGLYPKACKTLLQAFEVKNPACSVEQIDTLLKNFRQQESGISPSAGGGNRTAKSLTDDRLVGLRSLGDILYRQGRLEESRTLLNFSLSATEDVGVSSKILLSLGNVERALGNRTRDRLSYEEVTEIIDRNSPTLALQIHRAAIDVYQQAATIAPIAITQVQGQLNHLSLLLDIRNWWQGQTQRRIDSQAYLDPTSLPKASDFLSKLDTQIDGVISSLINEIEENLSALPPTHQGIYAQINFAHSLMEWRSSQAAEFWLIRALQQARTIGDQQGESYALGNLGQYYAQQNRLKEAIALTRQALVLAVEQNIAGDSREISYIWQSQLGKLLKQQGRYQEAIASYTTAFNTLQSLRNDLNANDRVVQFDFRQEVRPVYLELADLLLRSPANYSQTKSLQFSDLSFHQTDSSQKPDNLELARQVIESLQLAELDNFFQDPCSEVTDVAVTIDNIDSQAAVIYPIVLPERLEIILSLPGQPLKQVAIPISERKVKGTVEFLYDLLYNKSVDSSAANIFSTIPVNPLEVKENTQKLLSVLEQIYDWAIAPLVSDLESNQIETLVFVLNGPLQKVPLAALYDGEKYLLEKYNIALVPSLQLTDSRSLRASAAPRSPERKELKVLAAGVSQPVNIKGRFFPALTNVPQELNRIEAAFPASQQLLDEKFTTTTIKNRLNQDFRVIHLATHGLFSSNPDNTFIVTGDGQTIGIDHLRDLINDGNLQQPELLVLSACETAIGDERAVLGLAGVAVRSGTQSTLATLWAVEDASTAKLMGQFYQEFKQPGVKKIAALRHAQLSLLQSLKLNPPVESLAPLPPHPYYWAPYVLVGNWQ